MTLLDRTPHGRVCVTTTTDMTATRVVAAQAGPARNVADLYVLGDVLVLKGDTPMWVQVLNSFDKRQAREDARARHALAVLALKQDGTGERNVIEARYASLGRDKATEVMIADNAPLRSVKAWEELNSDPEWVAKVTMVQREEPRIDSLDAQQQHALAASSVDILTRLDALVTEEADAERARLNALPDDVHKQKFIESHIEASAAAHSQDEFLVTQIWLACRKCAGVQDEAGDWDHSACRGHKALMWGDRNDKASREEIRDLPDELIAEILGKYGSLSIPEATAKN